jgi:transposase-like protein
MPSPNPYEGLVSSFDAKEFALLSSAVAARSCREAHGFGTFADAAGLYRPHPPCPQCGFPDTGRDGWTASGLQRFECPACGRRYNSLTGTVLEFSKKDMPTWVDFINLMRFGMPLEGIAANCGVSHPTAFEWRHRVFKTVDGYQERIVLKDRVWIDETYVNDTDLSCGYGEARKRGLSKQKICIAVAIDVHKNPVAKVCGHGKPSSKRMRDALLGHIAPGSLVIHDKEKSHPSLIKAAKCDDLAYKADISDPLYIEAMAMVNNLCSWVKRYLWRFTGMAPANLQSYLNWYVYLYRVNQASDKWSETERVVRHLLQTEACFRSSF